MIYVGILPQNKREVFHADTEPTEASHGEKYLAVIGEFETLAGAEFMAKYGAGNPHCQCVDDAERLAHLQD